MISTPISLQPRQGLKICAPAISARSSGPTRHLAPAPRWQSSMFTAFRPARVKCGRCRTWSRESLGANLYFARLKGHGRSGDAMLEGSVQGWIDDFAEAVAIGRRLGERVVIMATSTGASLATSAAAGPDARCRGTGPVFTQLRRQGLRIGPADHSLGRETGAADCRASAARSKPNAPCMPNTGPTSIRACAVADGFACLISPMMLTRHGQHSRPFSSIRRWTGHRPELRPGHGGKLGRSGRNHRGHRQR
jgi:hypothetical protein